MSHPPLFSAPAWWQYTLEVHGCRAVAVDSSATAAATIRANARRNGVEVGAESDIEAAGVRLVVINDHAAAVSARHARRFFFVDADPFGAAAPHIQPAVAATRDGGLCSFASFDVGDLCGARPEARAACAAKVGHCRAWAWRPRCFAAGRLRPDMPCVSRHGCASL